MTPLQIHSQGDLERSIAFYQEKVDNCTDAINLLKGMPPNDFVLKFSIRDSVVFSFPIAENEADMLMSFFAYCHQFFGRTLTRLKSMQSNETKIVS